MELLKEQSQRTWKPQAGALRFGITDPEIFEEAQKTVIMSLKSAIRKVNAEPLCIMNKISYQL